MPRHKDPLLRDGQPIPVAESSRRADPLRVRPPLLPPRRQRV
jgi:hypothetical protein